MTNMPTCIETPMPSVPVSIMERGISGVSNVGGMTSSAAFGWGRRGGADGGTYLSSFLSAAPAEAA